MLLRNAIPIKDPDLCPMTLDLAQDPRPLLDRYLSIYKPWIINSSNRIRGFDDFKSARFCLGTTQAFDHFYIKHSGRRFRFFRGEFMYHRVCARSDSNWSYIEQDHLRPNDAVIISAPFSDLGKVHPMMEEVLGICDDLHIPVLLDLAYICISKNIDIDVTHPCIETITSSISKAFYGAQYLRAGIRWQKQDLDDGIDVSNSVDMVSMPSLAMAVRYIESHSLDWLWTRYEKIYHDVLQEFDLAPTNCILFGLGGDRYSDYNRGNVLNRVCISQEIGERYASMQSQ